MQTLIVFGGNLFEIAAAQFGDPLQWINLAQANNILDPMLTGQNEIIIPQFSTAFVGGIGPQ